MVDLLQNLCNFLNVCLMPFTPSQMRTDDGQLAGAMDPTVASAVTTQPADILKVVAYDSYRREDVFRIPVHTDLGSFWTQGGLTHVAAFDADSKAPLGRGKDAALVDLSLHGKMHNDDSQLAADLALVFRSGGVPGDFVAFDGTTSDADDRGSPVALLSKMGTTGEAIEGTSLSDLVRYAARSLFRPSDGTLIEPRLGSRGICSLCPCLDTSRTSPAQISFHTS